MTTAKTERLLNLVICLLSTRRPLTKSQIRQAVPQYAAGGSAPAFEAFERMFERDKDELRELGIPIVTSAQDPMFGDELGYRVDRESYALPDVHLEPDELAVVGLASRVWQQASLAGPAALALTKLKALGAPQDDGSLIGLEPRVLTAEPAFDALWAAVRDRRPVQFGYRTSSSTAVAVRTVEPWAVTSWHGRWYLAAHDRDRAAPRVFRLSRVEGEVSTIGEAGEYEVPEGAAARVLAATDMGAASIRGLAHVRVRDGVGQLLRHRAVAVRAGEQPGWSELSVEYDDLEVLVQELVTHGAGVVALDPAPLREAVVRGLRAVIAAAS